MTIDLLRCADTASALLGGLANAKRIHILCLLVEREHSVGALADKVSLSQSALSQHLAKLRDLGIVSTRRQGQTIFYSVVSDRARKLIDILDGMFDGSDACGESADRKHLSVQGS